MSGKENRPDSSTLESLLDDIEAEEKKVMEEFPDLTDSFDDDLNGVDAPTAQEKTVAPDSSQEQVYEDDFDDEPENASSPPAEAVSDTSAEPARSTVQEGRNGKSNLLPLVIIGLLVIIIIILLMQDCGGSRSQQEDWYDTSAVEGTLPGKTPEEIQAMLNQIVDEGMFNVSIAPTIVFPGPQAEGQARIENVPANHYNMGVVITLDGTSETVYESKGIRPGQYIEYITLNRELASGEYAATAMFTAYDVENLSEQGRVAVKIKLIVE